MKIQSGELDPGTRLRRQRLALVYESTYRNQYLSPIVGLILVTVLWPETDHFLLITWLIGLTLVSYWRHLIASRHRKVPVVQALTAAWERLFVVSLTVASAVWGVGTWLVMPPDSVAHQALVYTFVLGMAGGTSAIYAAHGVSVAIAMSLIMGPSTLYMFTFPDAFHLALGVGGVIFVFAVSRGTLLMNRATRRNIELADELERLARTDVLSGLLNRRGFTELSESAIANATRAGRSCVLIMADIDDFKAVNDRHGHAAGDAVIRNVGRTFGRVVRQGEYAARIGGEEFAVLLPDADVAEGVVLGNRILEQVRATGSRVQEAEVRVTVSVGVAASHGEPCTLDQLLNSADTALYRAKTGGRDRMIVWQDEQARAVSDESRPA